MPAFIVGRDPLEIYGEKSPGDGADVYRADLSWLRGGLIKA